MGLQKDGTYILDKSEQNLDCDRLYKSIWGHVQIMKGLPEKARKEREKAAQTAASALKRWFGAPGAGVSHVEEYDRERAHVEALRRVMGEKQCIPIDLERELFQTEMAMAEFRGR